MMKLFIFGGTFDPVHEGHLGVVDEVISNCDILLIAPTKRNPWKDVSGATFEQRIEMLEILFSFKKIKFSKNIDEIGKRGNNIFISEYAYSYAKELVLWLRENTKQPLDITWVVGPDIASEVSKWKDWDSLNVGVHVAKNYADDLHSTDIRDGKKVCHESLKEFIITNKLYQN